MSYITHISVVIVAKDAKGTIKKCLDSLIDFDEVVLYLNNTTDNTKEIASEYVNVKIIEGRFFGFGETKNKAAKLSTNNWVLSIDSDEVLEGVFVNQLKSKVLKDNCIYSIFRVNYYKDKRIKHCWGNDVIVRLYNRTITSFSNKKVHESILEKNLKIERLDYKVHHFPYSTISDFIVKLDRYSTIFSQENKGKKYSSPLKAILNAGFSFFKTYILKKGFLDGYAGLVIAFSHMATNFYKYIKLYELNKELRVDDHTNN